VNEIIRINELELDASQTIFEKFLRIKIIQNVKL